jgi:hypothetical protein
MLTNSDTRCHFHAMKNLLFISSLIIAVLGCQTTTPKEVSFTGVLPGITAPPSLQFRGEVYRAGYSTASPQQAIVEYYLPGEGPKSWRKMLALRLDSPGKKSLEQVKAMQAMLIEGGNRAVRAYQSTNGHGVEFILTTRGRQELNVFRYIDRTNGSVSLQYAETLVTAELGRIEKTTKLPDFYATWRSNSVWGLEAMKIPEIEKVR